MVRKIRKVSILQRRRHLMHLSYQLRLSGFIVEHVWMIVNGTKDPMHGPRDIFWSAITHRSFGFVLVHNNRSDCTSPSKADAQLNKRMAGGAQILQMNFLDHIIVG
jgi:DNA repair protein RadC